MLLNRTEKKFLLHLARRGGSSSVNSASQSDDFTFGADSARVAGERLVHLGLATKENLEQARITYTPEGLKAQTDGLAEVQLLRIVSAGAVSVSDLPPHLRQFGIPWAKKNGWVSVSNGSVALTSAGEQALHSSSFSSLPKDPQELTNFPAQTVSDFERRGLVVSASSITDTIFTLSAQGRKEAATISDSSDEDEISELNRHMLISGSWRSKPFAKYDLHEASADCLSPRRHPICALSRKISQIFVQMGFEQMDGPLIESAFWNFDSLFQPQDHPARELADTFYLPAESPLPSTPLVSKVKRSHESGWQYCWDPSEAKRTVLRTHTTAVSARALYSQRENPTPRKFFSIGKVFRNEATDYKHLAEFNQVEGIISWEGATFSHLLGTLKEFYSRLGFSKIRFRPSFFPYTEPSLEIEVFYPSRGEWVELGGAGILRPEVSLPLCSKYPVLAWGLSLERPLMLASSIGDIRTFYRNDLGWLRNFNLEV